MSRLPARSRRLTQNTKFDTIVYHLEGNIFPGRPIYDLPWIPPTRRNFDFPAYTHRLTCTPYLIRREIDLAHAPTCSLCGALAHRQYVCHAYTVSRYGSLGLHCALSLAAQCIVIGPVCVCGCVCLWVWYHDNSKLRASIFTKLQVQVVTISS